jgi:hypothetical protein
LAAHARLMGFLEMFKIDQKLGNYGGPADMHSLYAKPSVVQCGIKLHLHCDAQG